MSAVAGPSSSPAAFPRWTSRYAPALLLALHLPFVAAPPIYALTRREGLSPGEDVAVVLAAVALGALQLRHSLGEVRGERPRGWPATLLAVLLLAYGPTWWFGWNWASTQWFVLASVALLLPRRLVVPVEAGLVAGNGVVWVWDAQGQGAGSVELGVWTVYWLAVVVMGGLALYGSARLIRVVEDLHAARLELAELAVGRERLRVSRDLHDLLGQSLSAVSLKGDLALRLLPSDTAAARAEIEGLTELARSTLRDVRAVTHDQHSVSLRGEIDAATNLLAAAGVATTIDLGLDLGFAGGGAMDVDGGGEPADDVWAWAVREGTTNLLRHSDAQRCWITMARRDGVVTLEMVNDGVRSDGAPGSGTGLAGLGERAAALSGTVAAGARPDGRFRLVVAIPDGEVEGRP